MTDDRAPTAPRPPGPGHGRSRNALTWIAVAIVTIGAVAGIGILLDRSGILRPAAASADVVVTADGHYVVFLSEIEIDPRKTNGRGWDVGGSAPDVRYDVSWQGNRVFRSSVKTDSLLARWDQDELGLKDLLQGISSESALKAARITARPGETIRFTVVDSDALVDDEIGSWEVPVDSLRTGDQTWVQPAPGIRHATCRILRADQAGR